MMDTPRKLDIFTRHLARNKNVFVYTAAIASLAIAEEYQETALQLLKELDEAWDLNAIDNAPTKCLSEHEDGNDGSE
jgi:hypothetical protein